MDTTTLTATIPTITIPLREYLELLWGPIRPAACINKKELDRLAHTIALTNLSVHEVETNWFHISEKNFEGEPYKDQSNGAPLYMLWRPRDWETEYQRWKEQKQASDEHNKQWFYKTELEKALTEALIEKLGMSDDKGLELIKILVHKILKEKNTKLAEIYGIDISKLNVKIA